VVGLSSLLVAGMLCWPGTTLALLRLVVAIGVNSSPVRNMFRPSALGCGAPATFFADDYDHASGGNRG
jgi:hypothetical protein